MVVQRRTSWAKTIALWAGIVAAIWVPGAGIINGVNLLAKININTANQGQDIKDIKADNRGIHSKIDTIALKVHDIELAIKYGALK